ncbi:MAG: potassium channel family protein [Phycisphaerae bacterium]
MSARLRLILSILALLAVFVVGTTGYMFIEREHNPSLVDAAYMTTITLSTVGYAEVWPLGTSGKLWSIGVIVFGIGTVSIAFTSLVTLFVSGEIRLARQRKRMESAIERIKDHVIVCGYGNMGALAAKELARRRLSVVVIESARDRLRLLNDDGLPFIHGDATDEDVLMRAGVTRASALVATLPHDADNVFITLTARTLRPALRILARAEQPTAEAKLVRAGASRVICPQVMGASRIASILTRPTVVDFVDMASKGVDLEMDEYVVRSDSLLAGKSLRDSPVRQKTGAIVVAIKRADGKTHVNPDPDEILQVGDTLVLVGSVGVSSRLDAM